MVDPEPPRRTPILSRTGIQGFETLMPYRIREVLLVSSLYDAFILQAEGQVSELLLDEDSSLALRSAPRMTRVSSAFEAMDLLIGQARFDLVIVTPQIGGMAPAAFAKEVKEQAGNIPVVLLGYDARTIESLLRSKEGQIFDEVFVWTGDALILRSIITLIEDRANCLHDSELVGVMAVLLVEDSLSFLSSYLPLLYSEILGQAHRVISEGVNLSHKLLRLRARPKVLLARDLETATWLYTEHKQHLLGVIADIGFPREANGPKDPKAGFEFVRLVREEAPTVPVLMQSSDLRNEEPALALGAKFISKGSPYLHLRIREFMLENFGFGPFLFRRPDHLLEAKAHTIRELRQTISKVSIESLIYHAEHNHFSTWLRARTEFALANRLSRKALADFKDAEALRCDLLENLDQARRESQRGAIADFDRHTFDSTINFSRIGNGSLGGKARGLAFINHLLRFYDLGIPYKDVRIVVPPAVVITTEIFDRFMRENDLYDMALGDDHSDQEKRQRFIRAELPDDLVVDLEALLKVYRSPLAVRSSSLLEDSHFQPFAGVYDTLMLPNSASHEERLTDICNAIKLVYVSVFTSLARAFLRATPYLHDEEKMAVVIQELVGQERNGRFYPSFSGVARSHNYYPHGQIKPEDGVVMVALGLGKLVVAGEGGLRFCPRYPQSMQDFSSVEDILQNAQRNFYALSLGQSIKDPEDPASYQPSRLDVGLADKDGTLAPVGSVFSPEDGRISDGVSRPGHRLVTFANVLKHDLFPLAALTERLLDIGSWGMGSPVEIEFAVELDTESGGQRELALLQMRPMVVAHEHFEFDLDEIDPDDVVCSSDRTFGNGRIEGIHDILLVDPEKFERAKSRETATAIAEMNATLQREKRPYILIGPGRWGSNDPWLGIPVEWSQISGASVLVETGFKQFRVKPSEGSHFFHSMTAFHVAYFTLNPQEDEGILNLDWLRQQKVLAEKENGLVHLRLAEPALALLDGKHARGAVVKPGARIP